MESLKITNSKFWLPHMNPVYRIVSNKLVSSFYLLAFVHFHFSVVISFTESLLKYDGGWKEIFYVFQKQFRYCLSLFSWFVRFLVRQVPVYRQLFKRKFANRKFKLFTLCLWKNFVLLHEECYFDCNSEQNQFIRFPS